MTTGEKLFIACIREGNSRLLSSINRRWLSTESEKRQYSFIQSYFKDHGELIGEKTFCDKFHIDAVSVDAKADFYFSEIRERFIVSSLADKMPSLLKSMKDSPKDKFRDIQKLVADLAMDANDNKDSLYSDFSEDRIALYEERKKTDGVTYLSMGCEDLDKVFYGYKKNDLITIGGRSGQGKTWLLVYLSYLLEKVIKESPKDFGDILFITNEMSEEEIIERFDCMKFRLPYSDLMAGKLDADLEKKYKRGLKHMDTSKIRIVPSCQTIDELATLMGLYRPSVVFLDGSYLMESQIQEGWEKITYITRNLKRLAKTFNVPIVNTTQLKRKTGKSASKMSADGQEDFAYSNSYIADSDVALRMFQDADMAFHDTVGIEIPKGRRVPPGTVLYFQNDLTRMVHSITKQTDDRYGEDSSGEGYAL